MEDRKRIEREHYDRQAAAGGDPSSQEALDLHGPLAIEPHLRAPYLEFARAVEAAAPRRGVVVDIGAGTGIHSMLASRDGTTVMAADISTHSLAIARSRAKVAKKEIFPVVTDAERLPLAAASVDLVTSAGVLYCLDLKNAVTEFVRVLKPGGAWVFVDSYDHNIVYQANRVAGFLSGRRTKLAVTNIPDSAALDYIRSVFDDVSVSYYGVWTFVWPVARLVLGAARAANFLAAIEPPAMLKRYAFKIVVTARRTR